MGEEERKTSFWVVYAPIRDRDWILVSILPVSTDVLSIFRRLLLILGFAGSAWLIYTTLGKGEGGETARVGDGSFQSRHLAELPEWLSCLTPKEQTVLLFLLTGKSNKEIASILEIREQTVKNHLHATYRRIGAQDRFSAIILMQEAGLTLESLRRYAETHPEFPADARLFS